MAKTQGFNPRPKVIFTLALGLGIEGTREVVELELTEPMEPTEVLRRLAACAPPGLDWLDAQAMPPDAAAPGPGRSRTSMPVPRRPPRGGPRRPGRFLASDSWPFTRHRPDRDVETSTCARSCSKPIWTTTVCSDSA